MRTMGSELLLLSPGSKFPSGFTVFFTVLGTMIASVFVAVFLQFLGVGNKDRHEHALTQFNQHLTSRYPGQRVTDISCQSVVDATGYIPCSAIVSGRDIQVGCSSWWLLNTDPGCQPTRYLRLSPPEVQPETSP